MQYGFIVSPFSSAIPVDQSHSGRYVFLHEYQQHSKGRPEDTYRSLDTRLEPVKLAVSVHRSSLFPAGKFLSITKKHFYKFKNPRADIKKFSTMRRVNFVIVPMCVQKSFVSTLRAAKVCPPPPVAQLLP